MKITLGFSPCPNDTFIFDALVHHKIDTLGFEFEVYLEDVQTLNEWAIVEKLDCTKISYGVLPKVTNFYWVLNSGSALGKGVGPLLIGNTTPSEDLKIVVNRSLIAIPGVDTTAHLLFALAFPEATNKIFKVFHEIEDFVLDTLSNHPPSLGVIIHENRFTYASKGLVQLIDLGAYWEQECKIPIPLGGIVGSRKLSKEILIQIDGLIQQSVQYAFAHYPEVSDYTKLHAQTMSEEVMRQHINLYVNDYSIALGEEGKAAILKLVEVYEKMNTVELAQSNFKDEFEIFIN